MTTGDVACVECQSPGVRGLLRDIFERILATEERICRIFFLFKTHSRLVIMCKVQVSDHIPFCHYACVILSDFIFLFSDGIPMGFCLGLVGVG